VTFLVTGQAFGGKGICDAYTNVHDDISMIPFAS
jgi:hypothetical protein